MASIFTFDPDPPKVSSPWIAPHEPQSSTSRTPSISHASMENPGLLSDYGVTKLEAEPQEGPTEYKLHLLLRPRRAYIHMTTRKDSIGLSQGRQDGSTGKKPQPSTASSQPRQERLQHLTTQLLWRLQQSSRYHSASSKELVIPRLPDDSMDLTAAFKPGPVVSGLEESGGALYEIGVADDGTLVGLTKDEMDESLITLRVMAASLGCQVEVMRMVIVGHCEWSEMTHATNDSNAHHSKVTKQSKLWVAEALVTPNFAPAAESEPSSAGSYADPTVLQNATPSKGSSSTPQLRITLTGPTTSGKSSLLGTLSTGTLDNGRGKSRLSLLKHRHEMVSGVTSSVAQELIGYKDTTIVNYAHAGIESWVDIHDRAEGGRLLFVSDSGGHPRYRRTVLRGLMNWAPHWSILCIAADDSEQHMGSHKPSDFRSAVGNSVVDLVNAHLSLSLKLEVPMAVVITKMDIASKPALQKVLTKILNAIKEAGRIPKILKPESKSNQEVQEISIGDQSKVQPIIAEMQETDSMTRIVPIVLTSAMIGTGVGLLHTLLQNLPLPPNPTPNDYVGMALNPEQPATIFHIDDTFNLPLFQKTVSTEDAVRSLEHGVVVSGHIRFGRLSVGARITVGPFPAEDEEARKLAPADRPSPSYGLSISHPASAELAKIAMRNAVSASQIAGEWLDATIVSIRNLRLPVRTLEAGQAGSIGITFLKNSSYSGMFQDMPRIRRGMVLASPSKHMLDTGLSLQAASGFTASFQDSEAAHLTSGCLVNVYVASIRAAARIIQVYRAHGIDEPGNTATDELNVFSLNDDGADSPTEDDIPKTTEISLELLHNREWIEMGSRVILLEGGAKDKSGLDGIVGRIIEIVD